MQPKVTVKLSFGNPLGKLGRVQQLLVIGLMIVVVVDLSVLTNLDLMLRIGIAVLAFILVFLALIANELLNMQKEAIEQAQK